MQPAHDLLGERTTGARGRAARNRSGRRAAAPLRVEELEGRALMAAGLNETFVASLYQGVLRRNADAAGLSFWAGGLNAGTMTPAQVAAGIFGSEAAAAQ